MLDDHVVAHGARASNTRRRASTRCPSCSPGGATERRPLRLDKGVVEPTLQAPNSQSQRSTRRSPSPWCLPSHARWPSSSFEKRSPWLTVGWAATGAGLAALGGAALLGMSAQDAEDSFKAGPTRESFDHAKALETRTNVMLVVGSVLTAGGVAIVVFESTKPKEQVALKSSFGGIFAEGRF